MAAKRRSAAAGAYALAAALAREVGHRPEQPDQTDADMRSEYDRRIFDPALRQSTESRFASAHYADAVEAGIKCLIQLVHSRTGRDSDAEGTGLMTVAFSEKSPLLRVNAGRSKTDRSEQLGYMHLFAGVVAAFRNPRAHQEMEDTPESALMMLELTDHLMGVARAATRTRKKRA